MPVDPVIPSSLQVSQESQPGTVVTHDDWSPPRGNPFPVVGIGASAGGLEAFTALLKAIPADTGMAFVLVTHLDAQHDSVLAEILAPMTQIEVLNVRDDITIEPNKVYVMPPNTSMVIEGSQLKLAKREVGLHLPIDIFFRSLAVAQGSRAIGIILSGNASDGSLGLRAIKAECGLTFAQDESTARFSGMPHNAIATGAVDFVLSPVEIGKELAQLGRHPFLIPAEAGEAESETLPDGEAELKRIFTLLAAATKVDFSHYKPTTLRRRIGRRIMVLRLDSLREYARYVEQHPAELLELYQDLLISVTSFFRDPDTFQALSNLLANMLSDERQRGDAIRVWVPGCATGEEVYSIAIVLNELLQELQMTLPIQLFGTDISEVALERARHGIYSEIITENVSPERLRRYFARIERGYQIAKVIRENCVFAHHDVTRDPPFSMVDVVSCRNLLIYLDATVQRRVLPIFHYALKPSGFLLLGSAETTGAASDLFTTIDKQHSIYARKPGAVRIGFDLGLEPPPAEKHRAAARVMPWTGADLQRRLDRVIQSKYSPDAVLVDSELQIVQFRGHTSPYLDPAPGEASLNLLRMAREGLVLPLRRVLKAAAEGQHSVRERGVVLERNGREEEISLEVTPVSGEVPGEQYWLVVFVPSEHSAVEPTPHEHPAIEPLSAESHSAQLEQELSETREYLRNLTEDYEAHAEELRAANEEARSANEELQSTNEELSTTKEELQSANEELITINEELQNRNGELSATNSDLKNLLAAVSVAILMVDSDLRVRRFNTVAEKLLDLGSLDIGRPLGHLRGRIRTPELEQQAREVIDTLHKVEREFQDTEGHWYALGARPYRTVDDRIAGAVITIQDIDPLKRLLEAAEEARDYAEGMIETVREPLIVLDADLRVQRATSAFYETFLVSREETEGRFVYDLGNGQWNRPRLRELIGAALFRNESFQDYEVEHEFPHIGRRTMRLNARRIPLQNDQERTLLLAIEDVTERREAAEIRFQRLFETAKDGIVVVEAETELILDVNPYFLQCTGFAREDIVGKKLTEVGAFAGVTEVSNLIPLLRTCESIRHEDISVSRSDGGTVPMELVANLYRVGSQPVAQLNLRDMTQRKEKEEILRKSVEEKGVLVREIHHRVKNNLQVIVSLLSLQSGYTTDPKSLAAFEETEGRVRAIAHIHETLYATPDLAQIEFAAYLTNLVHELLMLHARVPDGIALELEAEEMVLHMEQAIPLGLIANELVLNSLKHGLSQGRGKLSVHLAYKRDSEQHGERRALDEGWAQLVVSDSGPGLPENVDVSQARSMGFRLLNLLIKQLRGKVEIVAGPGATVRVEFPLSYQ
ncbi:MAG: Chemotaxis protein methyltransferase CheR [Bryobacterales bacterium]|nr:Chemotaxis protein methyltransferase CheR [Bryobacterales bacterium]